MSDKFRVEAFDILQHLFEVTKVNDHTLHFKAQFDSQIDLDCLKKAVHLTSEAFPLVCCRFTEIGGHARWVKEQCDINSILSFIETAIPEENAEQFMLQKIDAFHAPQLKIGLFRNKERDTLCVLINHMLCDAAGFKDFLSLLSSTYTRLFLEPNYIPLSVIGGREVNALMKSYSKTDKRRMILYKNNKKLHGCDANFACEGNLDNPFIAVKTISKERFQKIKTYAKAQHATINDVVLTAFIRTFYTCQGSVISVPCTMDLRKFMPNHKANGICNLVTNVICDIGIEMGNTFGETLFKVKKAMDKAKTDVAFLSPIAKLNLAYRHLPYRATKYIVKKVFSNPTVAFTNIGILDPTHLTFGNTTMVSAFMTGSIKYAPYFQLALSTFREEMTFSVNLRGTSNDYEKIDRFLTVLDHELISAEQGEL